MKKMTQKKAVSIPVELRRLENVIGDFINYWGFKKIHGRIWAHLFVSQEPLDSADLMRRLKVSKGLMSLAIRDLLEYEVIRQSKVGAHGSVFYEANLDLQFVIMNVLKKRELKMLQQTQHLTGQLRQLHPDKLGQAQINPDRLQKLGNFTNSATGLLELFLSLPAIPQENFFDNLRDCSDSSCELEHEDIEG